MRVLLFSMPDGTHPLYPRFCRPPNLGLASLAGSLREDAEVRVADLILRRGDVAGAVREALEQCRPDLVGLSAMTFQYYTATRIAQLIRAWNPEVPIALGGYHATLMDEEISSRDGRLFDYVLRGEGERSFRELVRALGKGGAGLGAIAGLGWRDSGAWRRNPEGPLADLASLPLPDRRSRLWKGYHVHRMGFDACETSRGCKLPCNFCCINRMYGGSFRAFPLERILQDLEEAALLGARQVFFTDDNISLVPSHLEMLCKAFVESGISKRLKFSTQASVAALASNLGIIGRMAEAGFDLLFLGIESVTRRNLLALGKGDIRERTVEVLRELKRNGIMVMGGFILGSPDDREEDLLEQFRFMEEHALDSFLVQILTPYPRLPVTAELEALGLVANRDLRRYSGHFANVRTKHLSSRRLDFLRWKHFPYYRGPRWFLEALGVRRFPAAVGMEALFRLGEGLLEKARASFVSEDYAFRKYMERRLAENLFFGEAPELRWPDEDAQD
jgi:radical SAM superfamily enzyme YgiQ (UPF0313 family)